MHQLYPTAWNRNNDTGYYGAAMYRVSNAVINNIPAAQPRADVVFDRLGNAEDLQKLILLAAKIVNDEKGVSAKPESLPEIHETPEVVEVSKELRRLVGIDKKAQASMLKRISSVDKKLEDFDHSELELALAKLRQLGR